MSYVGIENSNEFYSEHYLAAIMEGDLKSSVFSRWSEAARQSDYREPWVAIRALAADFFKLRELLEAQNDLMTRIERHREFAAELIHALGYEPRHTTRPIGNDHAIPLLGRVNRGDGTPLLWWLPVVDINPGEFADPLKLHLHPEQLDPRVVQTIDESSFQSTIEDLVTREVFGADEPPRFVMIVGETQILLLDRSKWAEQKLLRFDFAEILGRREADTLKAFTALLHRDTTCPDDGTSVLDTLDESSHKHAFGVSKDLKYALREAIELLGNEAVRSLLEDRKEKVYGTGVEDALSRECLRFMYRLLFLFYIEARPELGYAPMKNEAYLKGYSVESLRELEMVRLHTPEARNGYYIHESLKRLFDLVYNGTRRKEQSDIFGEVSSYHTIFEVAPLDSHLFDPANTPTLNKVKLRNEVTQKIIKLLSLAKQGTGKKKRSGRISYAQLGINQLGAVYEALLSYRGFFAEEDLYEVKPAHKDWDPLETAYFVTRDDLDKYTDKERVQDPQTKDWVKHPKGKFIYRLAGREREKSASYYTPESLTKLVVKYALKELLENEDGTYKLTADQILNQRVCEPAMGSAAFLNEAVNQLAEAYLQQRQRELDERIPHDRYALEKQKVKTYLADNNVFGVDLNPIAVELAEVSLWLNTIHEGGFVPWFGMQLHCGNSLVGARQQVFGPALTRAGKTGWLGAVPDRVRPGQRRPDGAIYHWLLPDREMSKYTDTVIKGKGGNKPVKGLAEDEVATIEEWRKGFTGSLDEDDRFMLVELCAAADRLFERHTEMLREMRTRTTDPYAIYGRKADASNPTTTRDKDRIWHGELFSDGVRAASPYRRLKLAMDYWCALWFWPLEHADDLPSRDEFIFELSLLLDNKLLHNLVDRQANLFAETMDESKARALVEEFGLVDIDALSKRYERLQLVQQLAERYRFFHWELEFADTFTDHGGFDLVLGNPPWLKVEWNESGVMGDADPYFVVKKHNADTMARMREEVLDRLDLRGDYLAAYEESSATKTFLNARQNYPELAGIQTNLYKCFIPRAWMVLNESGAAGYLHPEGIYDDPKGGEFRELIYPRVRSHFQFHNERSLFPEVHHATKFSVNVYGPLGPVNIAHIANLFSTDTVDVSVSHTGLGPVPGIKDDNNSWNLNGHRDRIVRVTEDELALFAKLYDDEGTPALQARLPALHSTQLLDVLRKFAAQPRRLGDLEGQYFSTVMFDETYAQRDGTIKRDTRFPEDASQWVLSGTSLSVTPSTKPRATSARTTATTTSST